MVTDLVFVDRVGPGISDEAAVEIDPLGVRWDERSGRLSILLDEYGVHPTVWTVRKVAAWMFAEKICLLTGLQILGNIGLERPGSKLLGTRARRMLLGARFAVRNQKCAAKRHRCSFHCQPSPTPVSGTL